MRSSGPNFGVHYTILLVLSNEKLASKARAYDHYKPSTWMVNAIQFKLKSREVEEYIARHTLVRSSAQKLEAYKQSTSSRTKGPKPHLLPHPKLDSLDRRVGWKELHSLSDDGVGSSVPYGEVLFLEADPYSTPEQVVTLASLRSDIDLLLDELPTLQRDIITLQYGLSDKDCLSLAQIGVRFNISPEHVRNLESQAMSRLRRRGFAVLRGY
jgi:RNA polymerase sigma factor (sigma-70 family)